jgi:Uma2 family endonuclease
VTVGGREQEAVMGELARHRLTRELFYEWVAGQEARYELVDGEPAMMAGANRRHDRIAGNAFRLIANHLQGHRCQPFTSDTYVSIPAGNSRQPDLGIDCGPFRDTSLEAAEPALVVEILSPTTRTFDRNDQLEEYKTVPSLEYILLIDPDSPQVRLYRRDPHRNWTSERLVGLDAAVDIPLFGLRLHLGDLYANLEFRPRPTLVGPEDPVSRFSI